MALSIKIDPQEVWSRIYEEYWRKFSEISDVSLVEDEDLQGAMRDAMMSMTPEWKGIETHEDLASTIFDTREVMELTLKTQRSKRHAS
jgi:hypothetical protein